MKANVRAIQTVRDEGVSPVIAVILMVAITVVLAATVYVWVSGFGTGDQGAERATIRAQGLDTDGNGGIDYIRLTLVRGENAPYGTTVVGFTRLNPDESPDPSASGAATDILCLTPILGAVTDNGLCDAASADNFHETAANSWDVGETLYVPCDSTTNVSPNDGAHQLTVTLRGSTILDERINCDEPGG